MIFSLTHWRKADRLAVGAASRQMVFEERHPFGAPRRLGGNCSSPRGPRARRLSAGRRVAGLDECQPRAGWAQANPASVFPAAYDNPPGVTELETITR